MQKLFKSVQKNKYSAILALFLVQLLFSSCTSLNKSRVYAGLGGTITGAGVGVAVGGVIGERNGYRRHSNMLTGGLLGAVSGAILGVILANFFWNEDPENRKLNQMIIKNEDRKTTEAINDLPASSSIFEARQKALVEIFKQRNPSAKVYDVTSEPLPDDLKNEVMKQKIIIYDLPEQVLNLPDGRTILIKKTIAKEHLYEEQRN